MEDKLDLIIIQNWLLLGVIGLLLGINITCNWKSFRREYNRPEQEEIDRLAELWDKDEIDALLRESKRIREKYPNRVDALYFGGKALVKSGQLVEARQLFSKLAEVDYALRDEAQKQIKTIDQETVIK
ncbi:hypothetical protein [uncultured Gilvimarinus sp.]|uniref:hypothetical protein n=1 Tax=uncultured Gilvimarinus sp. TaxID=1689143 RepID=UPI0030EF0E9F|tara:strand:+ start:1541 stop:1924 length:384 start_codon:yes stop_codon:yes gene_type:complete